MRIDAIGAELTPPAEVSTQSSINQEEFIRLFLAQLRAQDPANATSNEEFLAQMAQFASLEQARITNEGIESLNVLTSTAQTTSLLGKRVEVRGFFGDESSAFGEVIAIQYTENGPTVTIDQGSGVQSYIPNISAAQVVLVQDPESEAADSNDTDTQ